MGKKSGKSKEPKEYQPWELLVKDFKETQGLEHEFKNHDSITKGEFKENIVKSVLASGQRLPDVLDELLKWKNYLTTRSEHCLNAFNEVVNEEFEEIRITLSRPFPGSNWHQLETITEEDLNKKEILLNGIPFITLSLNASLDKLLTGLSVNVKHAEVFPFDIDSYGLPPINCKKILNPLIWMRTEIESKIRRHSQPEGYPLNQIATSLKNAPKEGHLRKLAIPSFFLEKTADSLDYAGFGKDNASQFFDKLKQQFGTLQVNELTIVLPDMLIAYSEELLEKMLQVSYFIPFELLRLMFLCWRPEVVNLRLRTEACSSFEDAARIEWDDEEVFTSTTLYNSEMFERCDTMSLGDEKEIVDCKLIVDATEGRLFDPIHNEANVGTVGRDFLVLFPMATFLIRRTVTLKTGCSMIAQLKQQFEFIVNTFFCNAEEHSDRVVNYQLTLLNVGSLEVPAVRKHFPKKANGRKIGVSFEVEPETATLFEEFGGSIGGRETFANFFDAENNLIVDLKVVLSK